MAALIIREVHAIPQSQAPSEDRGRVTFTVSVALAVLSAFTVALRFLSRLKIQAPIQWDDWLCIPSLVYPTAPPNIVPLRSQLPTIR